MPLLAIMAGWTGKAKRIKKKARKARLAFLRIGGTQLRALLTPFGLSQHYRIEGFKGAFNWAPIMSKTDLGCYILQSRQSSLGEVRDRNIQSYIRGCVNEIIFQEA